MGPIALFDKSFLQSLSLDESVFFDHFFCPVICPIFYVETLSDLEKNVRQGRTPEQEVGIIADKVPEMGGYSCSFHLDLGVANLFGADIPMDGRIPTAHGRPVKVDGKSGFAHDEAPEAEAFTRWQDREFLYIERQFARRWRNALNKTDLAAIATKVANIASICKSLDDAKRLATGLVEQSGAAAVDQISAALVIFGMPPQHDFQVFGRWALMERPSFRQFAPYSAHIIVVEAFFQMALGAGLIGTTDRNNRTDIAYLYYAPFCQVFISSDNLHRRCAPCFLRADQSFVWGPDLKADINRLMSDYAKRPEKEREKGLGMFAPTPPADDQGLIVRLWDQHLIKTWRKDMRRADATRNAEEDAKLVEHINRVADAPALPASEMDFNPTEPDFVQLTRKISRKRGNWWQVPKDLSV